MNYLDLITSEHRTKPNFMAFLTAPLTIINDIQTFLTNMYLSYDIDNAVGPQLDTLGLILNTPRILPFQPSNGMSPVMTDMTYRVVLKFIIAQTHFNGTIQALYDLLQNVLADTGMYFSLQDNQDMSVDIAVFGTISNVYSGGSASTRDLDYISDINGGLSSTTTYIDIIEGSSSEEPDSLLPDLISHGMVIPRAEGVKVNIEYPSNKIFAFDMENALYGGIDEGYWV